MQEDVATSGKLSDTWEDKLDDLICYHDKIDIYLVTKDGDGDCLNLGTFDANELEDFEIKSKFYKDDFVISFVRASSNL